VRDELSRQRAQLALRVREREAELTRLRSQLSQRPASPTGDELESRLHALTQTLVLKQTSLETVTTEKNALRLQLEKVEVSVSCLACSVGLAVSPLKPSASHMSHLSQRSVTLYFVFMGFI
jgi:hypothetical protein